MFKEFNSDIAVAAEEVTIKGLPNNQGKEIT